MHQFHNRLSRILVLLPFFFFLFSPPFSSFSLFFFPSFFLLNRGPKIPGRGLQHSWCSRRCESMCQCTFHSTFPRPKTHLIGVRAPTEPPKRHSEYPKQRRADWWRTRFHVQKQVVQRKAEKQTSKFKHLAMH